ncbi:MAG: DUF1549 domain-containing protein [Armatimonas sp.]
MQFRAPHWGSPRLKQGFLVTSLPLPLVLLFALSSWAQEKPAPVKAKSAPKPVASKEVAKPVPEDSETYWRSHVEPLIDKACLKCHAGVRQAGGLDLRSLDTILRGGSSGPAIIPGKPAESRILSRIFSQAADHMPPAPKVSLTPKEVEVLKTWITMLPVPKSKLASGKSTDITWVEGYLADYRNQLPKHDVLPTNLTGSAAIDWFVQAGWKRNKVEPAGLSSDLVFARRVYLDLAGRIPSLDELRRFVADKSADKRERLIDSLMASDDYPRHMREVFDTVLMGRADSDHARARADRGWNTFLETGFRANRPWNEMVRDMIVARASDGPSHGADWFLGEKNNNYQQMAEAVAPVAFGVQVGCAQCHNHPLAWEIEQRHYWGMVAVFNRSKNVDTETGPGVAESATGGFISFANLKKETQPATLFFLNGKSVPEKIPGANEKEVDSPDLYVFPPSPEKGKKAPRPSVPKFSRREAFADSVTHDNPQLARAFANRLWALLMGRGIVPAVDQIDSRHRASHPELLEWLGRDFEKSGYDVKRLVRLIVNTRAYQLDTKPVGKTPPLPDTFARALEKPLSAEQLLHSLWIATGVKPEEPAAKEMERTFCAKFPDLMAENYNPSLQQALFLSNSPVLSELLKPSPGSMVTKLSALKSNEARVREAFSVVLGRAPAAVELQPCQAMLASARSPESGASNLLWALLTSAEFQVNH